MMKRIATSTKNVEQLPTQKEEGEEEEELVSESELRDEVLYKQRKVKRRSIDLRRGGAGNNWYCVQYTQYMCTLTGFVYSTLSTYY